MKSRKPWLKLAAVIADNLPSLPSLKCPNCGQANVDFQYVGDKSAMIGFLCVWCNSCMHGIHISRVRIPAQADLMSKDSREAIKQRIPNFN